jgi:hypothetical protein
MVCAKGISALPIVVQAWRRWKEYGQHQHVDYYSQRDGNDVQHDKPLGILRQAELLGAMVSPSASPTRHLLREELDAHISCHKKWKHRNDCPQRKPFRAKDQEK